MLIAIIVLVVVALLWISAYNSLIKYRNWVEESWSQIEVQLIRRADLIPNLMETVKGYMKHERETLEAVIQARNSMFNNPNLSREEMMEKSDKLTGALKSIFSLTESYPELKANEQFNALSEELTNTENKIAYARQLYNTTTAKYNLKVQTVPFNIVAGIHKFEKKSLLEATAEERKNVKVSF